MTGDGYALEGTMRRKAVFACCVALAGFIAVPVASATPTCPISYGSSDDAKPNKLYLYFPTLSDSTYPEFSVDAAPTSPVRFDVSQLSSYTGTAAALQSAVFDVVTDDYCELNAQVRQTTTAPPTTFARRNTVAIGTDADIVASPGGGTSLTWGLAQRVDTGDATSVDFAREWAGTYQGEAGGAGGALNGANSTVTRWANSIGGTAAHEAGHNYGLSHADGTVVASSEDALTHHIMASGSHYTDEERAGFRRHFSDHELSILASNIGLSIQTMHNWDLTNPNAQAAHGFRLTFLATTPTVIESWSYSGDRSPWINPSVSGSLGTTTFKGQTWFRHTITWTTGQTWTNGASGVVPGGTTFHVGATFSGVDFNTPDPIIITKSELLDGSGNPLTLSPRLPGYDSGTLDAADGSLNLQFTNFAVAPIIIRNVVVRQFPTIVSLNSLVPGAKFLDLLGRPLPPWPKSTVTLARKPVTIKGRGSTSVTIAKLGMKRHILEKVGKDCGRGDRTIEPDVRFCRPGYSVDLFPATTTLLQVTVVLPNVKHFVRQLKRYVIGDVPETMFVQIGGRHPDLNHNGRDDAIDIASGAAKDRNNDGVPDEAQREKVKRG
ncbi:MAG: hypothetical protein ACXV5Q_07980 [Frankiaceae bacterium]